MNETNRFTRAHFGKLLFCSLAAACLSACGGAGEAAGGAEQEAIGLRGAMIFTLAPEAPLVQGENDLRLILRDASSGEAAVGASIEVVAIMPAMGHEAAGAPSIEEEGDGAYAVRDLALSMPGRWDVHVKVEHAGRIDEIHFLYDVT